jgi:hypothetical protein
MSERLGPYTVGAGRQWQRKLFAKLGEGSAWFELTFDRLPEGDPARHVMVKLGRSVDGRLVCTGLLMGAEAESEITARSLRTVPMGAFLKAVAEWNFGRALSGVKPTRPARGRPGASVKFYEQVAAEYRKAMSAVPHAPVLELARRLGQPGKPRSDSTVRRWLRKARRLGLLGPALPGRGGELPTETRKRGKKR